MFITTRLAIGAVTLAALGLLMPGRAVWVFIFDGLLILAAIADVVLAPPPRATEPVREAPDVTPIGAPAEIAIRLRNPASRGLAIGVRDSSPPSLRREPPRHREHLDASSWITLRATIEPTRRGRIQLGPITVRTTGPLGLAGRQQTFPLAGEIHVYPALPGRAEVALRLSRSRMLQSGERSTTIRGGGTDFDSLREYHPDDEFRRINWKATARARKPISNVFREERNQHVLLLLDASRTMAATVGGVSRFEHGIDAAVGIAELAVRVGDHVGMLAFAGDVVKLVPPRRTGAQPRRIVESLFDLQPTLDAANYRAGFAGLLARQRRRALIVLITELGSEAEIEPLVDAMPALLRHHLVLVGSVRDPALIAMARSTPASSEETFEKAAAAGAARARERAAEHLRRLGATVIDRPPGELTGALADRYLQVKAYGRL